ncbi:hypothetical protein [Actinospica sp.]|uniref:hypothetical protein n=1 Tax=Actinospica sp. TaxID=1872142 RepID=UPI002C83A542|nr:hypothetical protein [Actinospica sp.]HWG26102.1 hypothetical protein [Actinospica sp.]
MAGPLSGDVDIPKVGKFPKMAIVVGVGGVVGLIILQNRKNSAAAAAPATAAGGDPYPSDGTTGNPNDPYSLDPTTGVTYGDEAASGAGTGYGGYDVGLGGTGGGYGISAVTDSYPWDGTYGNSNDPYSMDSGTGQTYGNEGATGTSPGITSGTAGPPFSTNAQWSQYVLTYFAGNDNLQALTDAIGLYLAGQTVTAAQQGLINDATAIGGPAPVSGPNGYPPSIKTAGSTSGVTTPTGGSPVASVSGGHVISVNNNDAEVGWTAKGATQFKVTIHGPGKINGRTNTISGTTASYSGLEAGHTYDVSVQALVNGKASGKAGTITVKTTKGK